jgi:DNA-binding NarL/FixJ family response regulator
MKTLITSREQQVLHLMARGLSSKTIATELNLSFYTVQTHRKNILRKLKETNTIRAISVAGMIGLLGAPDTQRLALSA